MTAVAVFGSNGFFTSLRCVQNDELWKTNPAFGFAKNGAPGVVVGAAVLQVPPLRTLGVLRSG